MTAHPLATRRGAETLAAILTADTVWRELTKPQREVLLSAAAGAPIVARADVRRRLSSRGLITVLSAAAGAPELTEAGRFVVAWRLP